MQIGKNEEVKTLDVQYLNISATERLFSRVLRRTDNRNKELKDGEQLKKIDKLEKSNVDVDQLLADLNISV